jgi:MiaB-like tRNA modifying enzyme
MKIYCETYGCTMNRADSETMLGLAVKAGHEPVASLEDADLVVVNTCAVKGITYRKVLRRLMELKKSNGKGLVVAGCLPLIDPDSIKKIGGFDAVISCKSISLFGEVLEHISDGEKNIGAEVCESCERNVVPKARSSPISAIIPIAEGCNSHCNYCSVKLARGELKSFYMKSIIQEITGAVGAGYREILLTAQDVAAYGLDCGTNVTELLKKISSVPGEFRIRVGMMNPKNVLPILPDLLEAFESEKVYKFLHLPVQSGNDEILKAMRRGYTADEFLKVVNAFREKYPQLYLCTDVIIGFPGEGEKEFMNTYELIKKAAPDKTNVSRFSPMPGTDAAKLQNINGREIIKRSRKISKLCWEFCLEKNIPYVGNEADGFVIEPGKRGGHVLRTGNYKPVIIENGKLGEFLKVKITEAHKIYLRGERS